MRLTSYKILLTVIFACCVLCKSFSQELNAKVTVVSAQIGNTVDKRVFQNLQSSLVAFLNKRKWTSDVFETNEKIECSFLINLQTVVEPNVYKGTFNYCCPKENGNMIFINLNELPYIELPNGMTAFLI